MRPTSFIVGVLCTTAIAQGIVFWLFAPYLTTGLEGHLPPRNWLTGFVAVVTLFVVGRWSLKLDLPAPK